jgi:hypothetical protein
MLSNKSSWKKREALWPLLFNSSLLCVIRSDQVNEDGLKLKGTRQLLLYTDDVIVLGRYVGTAEKKAGLLVVANNEIGI